MFWKKNALSYVFWLVYTIVLGSLVVFTALNHITVLPVLKGVDTPFRILVAVLPVLLTVLIGILVRRYIVRHFVHEEYEQDFWKIAEALALVAVLVIGIWLRYDGLTADDLQLGTFAQAMVTEGGSIAYMSHGASYLYMQMLRGLFLLFGNKITLAVWLQVGLFYIAGLFLYHALKRVVGKLPALSLFAFFLLAPYFRQLSLELSPLGLYLVLYCFCLFYLTEVLRNIHGKPLQYFFGGVQVAACIYLDFIGATLIPWAVLLLLMRGTWTWVVERWYLCLTTFVAGLLGGGVLLFVGDAFLTGRSWLQVLQTWWAQYAPDSFTFHMEYLLETPGILQIAVLVMVLLAIVSFWFRKKTDRLCPMIFLLAVVVLPELFGMSTANMPYGCWTVLQLVLVAFISFFEIFDLTDRAYLKAHQPSVPVLMAEPQVAGPQQKRAKIDIWEPEQYEHLPPADTREEVPESAEAEEAPEVAPVEVESAPEVVPVEAESEPELEPVPVQAEPEPAPIVEAPEPEEPAAPMEPKKPVRFLENPLPVPKRHARRVMDYPITDISDDDDYDIRVADDDDFDY